MDTHRGMSLGCSRHAAGANRKPREGSRRFVGGIRAS